METTEDNHKFYYFGYGRHINTVRMHMNCPSAKKVAIAKLEDYNLTFALTIGRYMRDETWKGAGASLEESHGSHIWGIVWEIPKAEMYHLDRLTSVDQHKSIAVYVRPENSEEKIRCKTFHYRRPVKPWRPSPPYKQAMIEGARDNNIPEEYVQMLEAVEDSGFTNVKTKCYQKYLRLWQEHIEMK